MPKKYQKMFLFITIFTFLCLMWYDSSLKNYSIEYLTLNDFLTRLENYNKKNFSTFNNSLDENKFNFKSISRAFTLNGLILTDKNILFDIKNNLEKKISFNKMKNVEFFVNIENLYQRFFDEINFCSIHKYYGNFKNTTILTSLDIKCSSKISFLVSIVYPRGSFLWMPKPIVTNASTEETVSRAFDEFKVRKYYGQDEIFFLIPDDIEQYLKDFEQSGFFECNQELALQNLGIYGRKYKKNIWKQKIAAEILNNVKKVFRTHKLDYWLSDGTLLGWYRDCSLIPHTSDIDVALKIQQYNSNLLKNFLGNKITPLIMVFGKLNDSLELRLEYNGFTKTVVFNFVLKKMSQLNCDIFFFYNLNSTHLYAGYQSGRSKMKNILSKFDRLCSAELFKERHLIPCNYLEYLQEIYGQNDWKNPRDNYGEWKSVENNGQKWSEDEYPNVIKYFDENGNFLQKKTLDYVNNLIENKIQYIDYNFDKFFNKTL